MPLHVELLCHCSCNIYACWHSVTNTNTPAVKTCLLDACWPVATQSACQPTFCHSTLHVCWRCASLSAIPAGMVSHNQQFLLLWCLTIDHAFWLGASLSAVPAGVVPHYRPCPLVWCLIISHVCWEWCLCLCRAFWCGASL